MFFYAIFGTIFGPILGLIVNKLQNQDNYGSFQKLIRQVIPSGLSAGLLFGLLAGWQNWVFIDTPSSFIVDMPDVGLVELSLSGMDNGLVFGAALGALFCLLWILTQVLCMLGSVHHTKELLVNPTASPNTPRVVWSWVNAGLGLLVGLASSGLIAAGNVFMRGWLFYFTYSSVIAVLFGINNMSIQLLGVGRKKSSVSRASLQAWNVIVSSILIGTIIGLILEVSVAMLDGTLWGLVIGFNMGLINAAKQDTNDNRLLKKSVWSWGGALKGAITGGVVGALAGAIGNFEIGIFIGDVPSFVFLGLLAGMSFGLYQGLNSAYVATACRLNWSWRAALWGVLVGCIGGAILDAVHLLPGKPVFGLVFEVFDTPYEIGQIDSVVIATSAAVAGMLFGINERLVSDTLQTRQLIIPVQKLQWSWEMAIGGFIVGSITGFIMGLIVGSAGMIIDLSLALQEGLNIALRSGMTIGLLLGFITGLRGAKSVSNDESIMTPNLGMRRSLRYATSIGLAGGVVGWIVGGIMSGMLFGLIFWFMYGGDACVKHFILRVILWRCGQIPWNYADFLDYCVEKALLRRVGDGYVFVHGLFQEYFAKLYVDQSIQPDLSEL